MQSNLFDSLEQDKKNSVIGQIIKTFPIIDSTNLEAKRQAISGAEHGTVFLAEEQTLAKGRLGRKWNSPKGEGLYLSILLRPNIPAEEISRMPLVAGLSICSTLNEMFCCNSLLKWPNDVIIGRKKVCGILTESSISPDGIEYVIIGIGINTDQKTFPNEISQKATSLFLETGHHVPKGLLLTNLLETFQQDYNTFISGSFEELRRKYCSKLATLGRTVYSFQGNQIVSGKAVDISADCSLIIETPDNERIALSCGEITVQGIY